MLIKMDKYMSKQYVTYILSKVRFHYFMHEIGPYYINRYIIV